MATMFPRYLDTETKPPINSSERDVFDKLNAQLGPDYSVVHGIDVITGGKPRQGEADFVVVHPDYGWINIEVKGYGVSKKASGTWLLKKGNVEKKTNDPYKQVTETQIKIRDWIRDNPRFITKKDLAHDWLVVFPFTDQLEVLQHTTGEKRTVWAKDMQQIGQYIEDKMKFLDWAKTTNNRNHRLQDVETFTTALAGQVETVESTLSKIKRTEVKLDKEEYELCNKNMIAFEVQPELQVVGGAGTGKTVLAEAVAKVRHARGNKVLFVCGGLQHMLPNKIRERLLGSRSGTGELQVANGREFLEEFLKSAGLDKGKGSSTKIRLALDGKTKKGKEMLSKFIEIALVAHGNQGTLENWSFDTLIVDETQNMTAQHYEMLKRLQRESGDKKRTYLFRDSAQSAYQLADGPAQEPTFQQLKLTKNMRNSEEIHDLARLYYVGDTEDYASSGVTSGLPVTRITVDESSHLAKLTTWVSNLLKMKVPAQDIVVLTASGNDNNTADSSDYFSIKDQDTSRHNKPTVWVTTPRKFQGLERNTIILSDISREFHRDNQLRQILYTTISRATTQLIIIATKEEFQRIDMAAYR